MWPERHHAMPLSNQVRERAVPSQPRAMRILLLNQFFPPDQAPTGVLLSDVAEHLTELGHDVTVICASTSYAGADTCPKAAFRIRRTPSLAFARGRMARPLSYVSYLVGAFILVLVERRPDLVVTLTTPPMLGLVGHAAKRLRSARHVTWEMDLYPEVAFDVGYLRPGRLARFAAGVSRYLRTRADAVIALSSCMRRRLMEAGVARERIYVVENWADGRLLKPANAVCDRFHILYSGNLGLAHDADTVLAAASDLADDEEVSFGFAGGGSLRAQLERSCVERGLRNVAFESYETRDRLNDRFARAAVGLVTQNAACSGSVAPSKVYAFLAAGKPVIYIGPADTAIAALLRDYRCGWRVANGDAAALTWLIRRLARRRDIVNGMGRNARAVFLEQYDRPHGVRRFCEAIGIERPASPEPKVRAAGAGRG
jgi:glycosyltransferase involved in cell wall biosynthesis